MNTQKPNEDLGSVLTAALALHQAGKLGEAEAGYRRVLEADPQHSEALRLLGLLAFQKGKMDVAQELIQLASEIDPANPQIHHDLGLVCYGLGQFENAILHYRRALDLAPRFAAACHNLGNAYHSVWCLDQAEQCYQQALELDPTLLEPKASLDFIQVKRSGIAAVADRHRTLGARTAGTPPGSSPATPVTLQARQLLPHVLNELGLTGWGVEVGVQEGAFSAHLLQHWKGRRLYSVDPWREFRASGYVDIANVPQARQDELYVQTLQRLLPLEGRSVVWRLTSREAASILPDGSLDFCYLDADHRYEAVKEDLHLWFPKVKTGGLLAGHDFIPDGQYAFGQFGVQRAVHEFISEKDLELMLTAELQFPSWFVLKT